ncbi:unnamed protein product [Rotaria magnacalcarata]|uniref:PiggyBac transposable element-derived protein domain-containing protein n=2 Tax=Rotaria magnacalcarata TaxID=392030 RepID=A0A816SJK2_9BILA|nr:unnamed protein product [Rotaria magnacalcarata]CAF4256587.1 unnamed protein product [Rotaria magnacalcarata]CAF4334391.1 unnamed protein product [Rotaria magnacalcarata]
MPNTRSFNRYTIIPNGSSEEEVDSPESEDEIGAAQHVLQDKLIIDEDYSFDFTGTLPPPSTHEELEPTDYFYYMFGKESIMLMTNQSNLYSTQMNPNKPLCVTEDEMKCFIGLLLITGVYSFPQ